MSLTSLELDILFNKIILKLCTSTKNLTNSPMPLELLREELQILICISVALELKIISNRLLEFSLKTSDYDLLIDNLVRVVLLSSKRKLVMQLALEKKNSFTKLYKINDWLIKYILFEEYTSFITLIKWIESSKINKNEIGTPKLITCLVENLIIKLSNIIVLELFSTRKIPKFSLCHYVVDSAMFKEILTNLKFYLYWKSSIGSIYLQIRKLYTYTYLVFICSKDGFLSKNFYSDVLIHQDTSTKIYNPLIEFLKFLGYMFYKK
jgi:hypothetical protein